MESLSLTTTTTTTDTSKFRFSIPCYKNPKLYRNLPFYHKRHRKFLLFAAKDEDKFDSWDQMELKFGKLIGEDPKLTHAKIIGRKAHPELSYLEIEKLYNRKGNKTVISDIEEVPFDVSDVRRKPNDSLDGLNLTRPVPKKGVKFETSEKPVVPKLERPNLPLAKGLNNPRQSVSNAELQKLERPNQPLAEGLNKPRQSVPNAELRKPTTFKDDDGSGAMLPRPKLSFKVSNEQEKERFTDMTLVRKPAPFLQKEETEVMDNDEENPHEIQTDVSLLQKPESFLQKEEIEVTDDDKESPREIQTDVSLLQKPEITVDQTYKDQHESSSSRNLDLASEMENVAKFDPEPSQETGDSLDLQEIGHENDSLTGSQPSDSDPNLAATSTTEMSLDTALRGPPKRLDQSTRDTSKIEKGVTSPMNPMPDVNPIESENLPTTPFLKEREDADWKRAEYLIKTEGREEVELINSSTRGFVASFGSLIGFLPYRNLATKWKYLAFESWLRKKGLDPAVYRQSLGVIGGYNATSKTTPNPSVDPKKIEGEISADMKLEDLLAIYDHEKLKYLSSFVGQKIKVNVVLADRELNKLIFSAKPKEKEESVERKRSLMAKLSVGDVVKCCIKKITYYGIFVEVEGVPALIHQTEVSWDDTLDPILNFKIGQVVEAKVHQLDFSLERIFLSLKEITPDPLTEALEAVIGDQANLDGRLKAAEPDEEVYMASVVEKEYKLLARAGNKVQEVIVETSMGKEEMKSAILTCTNRV
ncbi:Nucleic acid-binding, OB-fold [Cynara cardunculus var. scolymus]|uniref:Nucleic acid-binding, OB-fold n=1 Tax=Cynara cardunculus var. scolymus TaxID=59895 RepID=A0A103XG41_CYNCS|nr:Nucleic acid-binding, OB-fold [Cynara cardunculus var. scolymus]